MNDDDDFPPADLDEALLRTRQVAKMFGVRTDTVRVWIRTGKLPSIVVNGQHLIRRSDALNMRSR